MKRGECTAGAGPDLFIRAGLLLCPLKSDHPPDQAAVILLKVIYLWKAGTQTQGLRVPGIDTRRHRVDELFISLPSESPFCKCGKGLFLKRVSPDYDLCHDPEPSRQAEKT